jgi:hypothetical protein
MVETEMGTETRRVLEVDPEEFQSRVEADAEVIKTELAEGTFDNPQGIVGLEYEFYAVSGREATARGLESGEETAGALRRIPRRMLSYIGFEKELGLHNAEMSTTPQPLNDHGLAAQETEVKSRLSAAREPVRADDMRLVSDGLWTIPPAGEDAVGYLTDSVEEDELVLATNMSDATRYHAMANGEADLGMRLDVPNVTLEADTIMPESLITSIQPHYQVPHARDLAAYFRYALRVAGPLLALGVNSPFFPPDCYDDVSPERVLDEAWMGHRIRVFETLNGDGTRKVRFPDDVESTEAAVDAVVEDETVVPMPVDAGDRFDDRFAHFRRKHGSFWRWVRPVFGGATRPQANARIEFRPIAAQPTVRDSIAFQAAFAGALEALHASEHPAWNLDWETARDNFYAAMRDGLGADLTWITADGDETDDVETIYGDLLAAAESGLRARGVTDEQVGRYLLPLRERVRDGVTPARWKHGVVREHVDEGEDLRTAIYRAQREYIRQQTDTLLSGRFVDWDGY